MNRHGVPPASQAYVKARKTYATQQCWRFPVTGGSTAPKSGEAGNWLGALHVFVALRGPEMQNANPKVGVLFSPSAV
jgi:hypothetical protein